MYLVLPGAECISQSIKWCHCERSEAILTSKVEIASSLLLLAMTREENLRYRFRIRWKCIQCGQSAGNRIQSRKVSYGMATIWSGTENKNFASVHWRKSWFDSMEYSHCCRACSFWVKVIWRWRTGSKGRSSSSRKTQAYDQWTTVFWSLLIDVGILRD